MSVVALQDVLLAGARIVIEDEIERLIGGLDQLDARTEDREPDAEDEVVSEDDGVVTAWMPCCGRQG